MRAPRRWHWISGALLLALLACLMLVRARPGPIGEREAIRAARETALSNVILDRPLEGFRVGATWRAAERVWRVVFADASAGWITVDVPPDYPNGWTTIRSSYPMGK